MHDDLLERRLRDALRTEGDQLAFTITADELRRRYAVRRRSRMTRTPSLLLAAAIGVGLVGAGVVAGQWLSRIENGPSPIPSAPIAEASLDTSPAPTPPASEPPVAPTVPNFDTFLAPLDPGRIVRAQAVGPRVAPSSWSRDLTGPGSATFAPVTVAGSYRVYLACAGENVTLDTTPADPKETPNSIPITCDGETTARDLGLAAGDAVAITATAPVSWRFALLAPDRSAPHADAIASEADVAAAAGPRNLGTAQSASATPDYRATQLVQAALPGIDLNVRDAYRVAVSCAGPGPLTYRILSPSFGVTDPVEPAGAALASTSTAVDCDGGIHVDVLRFPFSIGGSLWVDAPEGTAWRISAAFEDPPIHVPADGGGWGLPIGVGPNLELTPVTDEWNGTFPKTVRVRLVITCYGGTSVDVTLREAQTGDQVSGTGRCATGRPTVTVIPVPWSGRSFDVTTTTHGPMWVSVAIQQATD